MSDNEVMDIDAAEDATNEQNTPLRARELDYEGATTETDAQEGGFFSNVSETKKMMDTALVLDRGETGGQTYWSEYLDVKANKDNLYPDASSKPGLAPGTKSSKQNLGKIRFSKGRYMIYPHVFSRTHMSAHDGALRAANVTAVITEVAEGKKNVKRITALQYRIEKDAGNGEWTTVTETAESSVETFVEEWQPASFEIDQWDEDYSNALQAVREKYDPSLRNLLSPSVTELCYTEANTVEAGKWESMVNLLDYPRLRALLAVHGVVKNGDPRAPVEQLLTILRASFEDPELTLSLRKLVAVEKKINTTASPAYGKLRKVLLAAKHEVGPQEFGKIVNRLYFHISVATRKPKPTPARKPSSKPAGPKGPPDYRVPKKVCAESHTISSPLPSDDEAVEPQERGRARSRSTSPHRSRPENAKEAASEESDVEDLEVHHRRRKNSPSPSRSRRARKNSPSPSRSRRSSSSSAPRGRGKYSDSDSESDSEVEIKYNKKPKKRAADAVPSHAEEEGTPLDIFCPVDGSVPNPIQAAAAVMEVASVKDATGLSLCLRTGKESMLQIMTQYTIALENLLELPGPKKLIEERCPPADRKALVILAERIGATFWSTASTAASATLEAGSKRSGAAVPAESPEGTRKKPLNVDKSPRMDKPAKPLPPEKQADALRGSTAKCLNNKSDDIEKALKEYTGWEPGMEFVENLGTFMKGGQIPEKTHLQRVACSSLLVHCPGSRDPNTQSVPLFGHAIHGGIIKSMTDAAMKAPIYDLKSAHKLGYDAAKKLAEEAAPFKISPQKWADLANKPLGRSAPPKGSERYLQNGWVLIQKVWEAQLEYLGASKEGLEEMNRRVMVCLGEQKLSVEQVMDWLSQVCRAHHEDYQKFRHCLTDEMPIPQDRLEVSEPIEKTYQSDKDLAAMMERWNNKKEDPKKGGPRGSDRGGHDRGAGGRDERKPGDKKFEGRGPRDHKEKNGNHGDKLWVGRKRLRDEDMSKVDSLLKRDAPRFCRTFVLNSCNRNPCPNSHKKRDWDKDLERYLVKKFGGEFKWNKD